MRRAEDAFDALIQGVVCGCGRVVVGDLEVWWRGKRGGMEVWSCGRCDGGVVWWCGGGVVVWWRGGVVVCFKGESSGQSTHPGGAFVPIIQLPLGERNGYYFCGVCPGARQVLDKL